VNRGLKFEYTAAPPQLEGIVAVDDPVNRGLKFLLWPEVKQSDTLSQSMTL